MGTKTGTFVNLAGEVIRVTFTGADVSTGDIEVLNVELQMDGGGGEYLPIQYTTATVRCVTDGLKLMDLYASTPLAVSVRVQNMTTGAMLFCGYVAPMTYNQSVTGYNDELAIECADWLGTAKIIPYRLIDKSKGFNTLTLNDALLRIARLIDPSASVKVAEHITIESGDGEHQTNRYDKLTLSETYFAKSIEPTILSNGPSYAPSMLSLYDILEMIAESFRSTFVQVGGCIYLTDAIQHRQAGNCWYRQLTDNATGFSGPEGEVVDLTDKTIDGPSIQVSSLPQYSTYSISRQETKSIDLLQNPFDKKFLKKTGKYATYNISDTERYVAELLQSSIYDVNSGDSTRQAHIVGYINLKVDGIEGLDFWTTEWDDGRGWNNCLRIINAGAASADYFKAFSRKLQFNTSLQAREQIALKLEIEAAFSQDTSRWYPYKLDKYTSVYIFISMRAGNKYYTKNGVWAESADISERIIPLRIFALGKEWGSEISLNEQYSTDYTFESCPGGDIEFSLYIAPKSVTDLAAAAQWYACYIRKLSLTAVPGMTAKLNNVTYPVEATEYLGAFDTYKQPFDNVTLPIEVREPLAEKWWGTVIDGVDYMREPSDGFGRVTVELRYRAGLDNVSAEEYSILERIKKMAELHDGYELEVPISGITYSPLTVVASPAWSGYKVVTATTVDVYNNTTNLRIQ